MSQAIALERVPLEAPGGLLPWLDALFRDLRRLVRAATATKEQRELLSLIDYAASHIGGPLLEADSLDDLDDRIDAQIADPTVFHVNALLLRLALPELRKEPGSPAAFTAAAAAVLGPTPAETLANASDILAAWLHAQHVLLASIPEPLLKLLIAKVEHAVPAVLVSPDIPAEVASGLADGLRAGVISLAITRAIDVGDRIDPWLAQALVERLVGGARGHLRLLASMPGAQVSESIVPEAGRLDLAALDEQHARARAHAGRTLEIARQRRRRDA